VLLGPIIFLSSALSCPRPLDNALSGPVSFFSSAFPCPHPLDNTLSRPIYLLSSVLSSLQDYYLKAFTRPFVVSIVNNGQYLVARVRRHNGHSP